MLFALICAVLLLIVIAAVSLPLLSGGRAMPMRGDYDRAVYRDQLLELERDLARGVVTEAEAGAARLEIQRRLLAAGDATGSGTTASRSPFLAILLALFVILGSGALYWRIGAPDLADAPFADRPPREAEAPPDGPGPPRADIKRAAERLEQKLAADPSNGGDWILYARASSMLGEWAKAAGAYKHAIDLGEKRADVFAAYGEMQVMAADGIVAPAAREAFTAAMTADPSSAVARYYLALADSQAGEERHAIDAWLRLAAGLPEDSPMREAIAHRIADAAHSAGIDAPPLPKGLAEAPPPGPTQEQMDAAAGMTPEQRAQMIRGMIEKLAEKLKAQPNDPDGWSRLGQAYLVLGDNAKAVDAYDHAAALKPGDAGIKLQTVGALLSGLKPDEAAPPRAIAMLNEVALLAPDAPEVLWYLGLVAARDGNAAEAREKWTKLLASLPDGGEDAKMVQAALRELPAK